MAGLALWIGLGLAATMAPRPAVAQMAESMAMAPDPTGNDENWLVRNIVCQCGSCRHMLLECMSENCGHAIQDRIEIRKLLDQKKTRDEIIQHFITKYGSQVALAAPIDKGFNRLAWLLPYSLGAIAAGGMVYGAYRMARKPAEPPVAAPPAAKTPEDQELADKLEDELRNLD
jgi:cytochrome c-type biogenesis protein CcmH/NrfF